MVPGETGQQVEDEVKAFIAEHAQLPESRTPWRNTSIWPRGNRHHLSIPQENGGIAPDYFPEKGEGGWFYRILRTIVVSRRGIDTLVIGPGSIAQAHQVNEFVDVEELRAAAGFMPTVCSGC